MVVQFTAEAQSTQRPRREKRRRGKRVDEEIPLFLSARSLRTLRLCGELDLTFELYCAK